MAYNPGNSTWLSFPFTYADFSSATSGKTAVIGELPPGAVVQASFFNIDTTFGGGSLGAYAVSIGYSDNGGDQAVYGNTDLFSTIGITPITQLGGYLQSVVSVTHITATAQSFNGYLNEAGQGEATLYLLVSGI